MSRYSRVKGKQSFFQPSSANSHYIALPHSNRARTSNLCPVFPANGYPGRAGRDQSTPGKLSNSQGEAFSGFSQHQKLNHSQTWLQESVFCLFAQVLGNLCSYQHTSQQLGQEGILAWNYNLDNDQVFLPCILQPLPAHSPIPGLT